MDEREAIAQLKRGNIGGLEPADVDLWPAIHTRLQPPTAHRRWIAPTTRLGWAFLTLGLVLVVGFTAYAMSTLWGVMPFWRPVEEAGLGQVLHLSETMNGFTVTLERAYADANEVLIGFTVTGPADQRVSPEVTLTDGQGTGFKGLVGMGMAGRSG